jgi:hypothetical protein
MTADVFKTNLKTYRLLELVRGAFFMVLLGATALPVLFVIRRLDHAGLDATSVAVLSTSFVVIAALMFYTLVPWRKRVLVRLQADCPACGKLLLGRRAASVTDTGRCPACGRQVLDPQPA